MKFVRIVFSAGVLLLFLLSYFFTAVLFRSAIGFLAGIQLVPVSLAAFSGSLGSILALTVIVAVTLLFGRLYCSFLCPLGISSDIFTFAGDQLFRKKHRFIKSYPAAEYLIFIVIALFFLFGSMIPVNFTDPYSIFSRFMTDFINPLLVLINNGIASLFDKAHIFTVPKIEFHQFDLLVFLISGVSFAVVMLISLIHGRVYCTHICPIGIVLGFISRFSIFKIGLDKTKCISCGKCERICKANCIDIKTMTILQEHCLRCFDCLPVCPKDALAFTPLHREKKMDSERKKFFELSLKSTFVTLLVGLFPLKAAAKLFFPGKHFPLPGVPLIPPGAVSLQHFTANCTGCNLCVSKCPPRIIKPGSFVYGLNGILEPELDYTNGYCQYDCKICSEVCPTNAITPVTLSGKKLIQIGTVQFRHTKCVVVTNGTDCGACAEHCPTGAVSMVDYKNNLRIPHTDTAICIGCGACFHMCPVRPERAIIVEPLAVHAAAKPPYQEAEQKKQEKPLDNDFPF